MTAWFCCTSIPAATNPGAKGRKLVLSKLAPSPELTPEPRFVPGRGAAAGRTALWLAALGWIAPLSYVSAATAQSPPTPSTPVYPIAKSAQVSVEASPVADALILHIRRVNPAQPVISDDVKVTIDGKSAALTRLSDGSYQLGTSDLGDNTPHDIELVVPHDGIRELLTGTVTLPAAKSSGGFLGEHKQTAWWILNIVVVLIAAIAISRRKSAPPPDV